jgi:hypothetical protein
MVGDKMNLVEVTVEKDSNDNPTCIVWPDGRRFAISSSGAPLMCPSLTAGRFAYVRDVYVIGRGNRTHRRSIIADGGKWYVASLK